MRNDIVLMGPPNVGKTTVAGLIAKRLQRQHHELDELRRGYFEEIGFDMDLNLKLFHEQGWDTMSQYWEVFTPYALERFVADHDGVLDLGGGSAIAWYPPMMERIERALAPFRHRVLLMPDPDIERSLAILADRESTPPPPSLTASQRLLMSHGGMQHLATHVVYTGRRPPQAIAAQIVKQIEGS